MSKRKSVTKAVPLDVTHHIRDTCLCLHVQRAARVIARYFDEALRETGLTNQQFSLLNALNRPVPAQIGRVAQFLAMDRTTLTANLKPLERQGLVTIASDPADRRARLIAMTDAGRAVLSDAVPVWKRAHAKLERSLGHSSPDRLRSDLRTLS